MFDYDSMPLGAFKAQMRAYLASGAPPGAFLTAILSNDLRRTLDASETSAEIEALPGLFAWLRYQAPTVCYGSHEAVRAWIEDEDGKRTRIIRQLVDAGQRP